MYNLEEVTPKSTDEVWLDVPFLPDYYQVSSLGRVRSKDRVTQFTTSNQFGEFTCERLKKGRLIPIKDLRGGYPYINFFTGTKIIKVPIHRVVALAFLPNPDNLPQVNHINGDKLDNSVFNLEWCSASENRIHATRVLKKLVGEGHGQSKLTEAEVLEIRQLVGKVSVLELTKLYSISKSQVQRICKNQSWKHI